MALNLNAVPSIAAIGIIGKHDNPLHISHFPPQPSDPLPMLFLINSCLDIFALRASTSTGNSSLSHDLGLLQAVDERLSCYGWQTNTGIKFVIVIDMMGGPRDSTASSIVSPLSPAEEKDKRKLPAAAVMGLRDADLRPAFRAVQTAYIQLMLNPFYSPDDRTPLQIANYGGKSPEITSKKFINELKRIGKVWTPGIAAV
ncbi:uncharacterized protein A1O9_07367 [Exophiala aquamarina CBS 119918]|uniref:Trafficking protein particle complex subunit 2-like protein n=1 Tax=Exophiala aquamarina CBS 119918 TaxID=1182545 RepID=A0A072PBN9_9EURO|nr:uncharacterized protein A1O9_07367 [Exophiala aquamarina CBS 119918]KEF57177.1 hypothetical protein A1O9_07367 [Exophiala aquamarina CBS 119918]